MNDTIPGLSPVCSIVIRAFNEEKYIGKLLLGIAQQTVKDVEIILVDSGSTDSTVEIASRFPVRVVQIQANDFTFGSSLNRGIREAKGELIVIASAHVYPVYTDWLDSLIRLFSDPQVALVYGKQRGAQETKFSEHQIFARWFPEESNLDQDHPFCNNANAAIRRAIWEKYPYDETLTGLEDLEWANRVMKSGYKIAYTAEAEIVHVHEQTSRGIYNRYRREAIAFRRIFPRERFHFGDFIRLFIANTTSDIWHAFHQNTLFGSAFDIVMFRLMQFWGTFQGYRYSGEITKQLRKTFYYPPGNVKTMAKPASAVKNIDYSQTSYCEVETRTS